MVHCWCVPSSRPHFGNIAASDPSQQFSIPRPAIGLRNFETSRMINPYPPYHYRKHERSAKGVEEDEMSLRAACLHASLQHRLPVSQQFQKAHSSRLAAEPLVAHYTFTHTYPSSSTQTSRSLSGRCCVQDPSFSAEIPWPWRHVSAPTRNRHEAASGLPYKYIALGG